MGRLLNRLPLEEEENARRVSRPREVKPMLATLVSESFSDPAWIFERKLDGERCLAFKAGGGVRLVSRNGEEITDTYPELAEALESDAADGFVVDGEVVAFSGSRTSFSRLQGRMQVWDREEARRRGRRIAVYYYLFDLLYAEGHDLTGVALRHRKRLLKSLLEFADPLRYTPHRNGEGEALFAEACRKGREGVIAKEADSTYVHSRSRKWLKFKCVHRQEFVIGGFTDPGGERTGFGALLLGYYDGDSLVYAGKVGTGFDGQALEDMGRRLRGLERKTPPFDSPQLPQEGVHWVTPSLVGEVGFTEWTGDGKLRHPRFLGLRRSKEPGQVRREFPEDSP